VKVVPWEYFDITSGPYGLGKWSLYELGYDLIGSMKEEQLIALRADLLVSYGKGDKGFIGTTDEGDIEQFGDLSFAEWSMERQGGSGQFDDKWPTDRAGLLKVIGEKEYDLAQYQEDYSYWLNEYNIVKGLLNDIAAWDEELQGKLVEEEQLLVQKNTLQSNLKQIGYDIYTLAEMQQMLTDLISDKNTIIGHIDNIKYRDEVTLSLIEQERDALLNALSPLYEEQTSLMETISVYEGLVWDVVYELGEMGVLSAEESRLVNVQEQLLGLQSQYSGELEGLESRINTIVSMAPYERAGLQWDLNDLTVQRDGVNADYQAALVLEQNLITQEGTLSTNLTTLEPTTTCSFLPLPTMSCRCRLTLRRLSPRNGMSGLPCTISIWLTSG
jgi:hypothetical protein